MYLLQLGTGLSIEHIGALRSCTVEFPNKCLFHKNSVTLLLSPFGTRVVKECQFPQCYGSVGSDGWRGHGLVSCACRNIILHPSLNLFLKKFWNSTVQLSRMRQ